MLDLLVGESFTCLRDIRDAEANLSDKQYVIAQLISASHHLDTIMHIDEYFTVSDLYLKLHEVVK